MGELWIAGKKERGLKEEGKRNALFSLYTVTYHLLSVTDQPISLQILYRILFSRNAQVYHITILLTVIRNSMTQISTITA